MVISDVNQITYNGDGITYAWPFTFRIIDATDIKLVLIDTDGAGYDIKKDYWVDTVNNTVYYPGYAPGSEPPEEDQPPKVKRGQKLVVYRELPATQEKDLGNKWPFYVIELALDKLTMLIQDVMDVLDRCFKISVADQAGKNIDMTIPMKAGKLLRVNKTGTGFEAVSDAPDSAAEAEKAAQEALAAAKEAERVARSVTWPAYFTVENDKLCQIVEE